MTLRYVRSVFVIHSYKTKNKFLILILLNFGLNLYRSKKFLLQITFFSKKTRKSAQLIISRKIKMPRYFELLYNFYTSYNKNVCLFLSYGTMKRGVRSYGPIFCFCIIKTQIISTIFL
jgi:hypothetical protein